MATDKKTASKQKSGPKPETVKIEGDWEAAIDTALQKKRPAEGWPKPEKKRKS